VSVTTTRTYSQVKCLNYHHLDDAEQDLGHPVIDNFTMNAEYDADKEVVTCNCPWCGYNNEVNVAIRPVQIEQRSGFVTIGPPA
jgi:hypothetical protein